MTYKWNRNSATKNTSDTVITCYAMAVPDGLVSSEDNSVSL